MPYTQIMNLYFCGPVLLMEQSIIYPTCRSTNFIIIVRLSSGGSTSAYSDQFTTSKLCMICKTVISIGFFLPRKVHKWILESQVVFQNNAYCIIWRCASQDSIPFVIWSYMPRTWNRPFFIRRMWSYLSWNIIVT